MTNKDLIKQYINTGLDIDKYQFNKLSNSEKKSYMRARIMSCRGNYFNLQNYEFDLLPEDLVKDVKEKEYQKFYHELTSGFSSFNCKIIPDGIEFSERFHSIWFDYLQILPPNVKIL